MSVVRGVINLKSQGTGLGQVGDREVCVEAAVTLAGRIGACLIHARLAVSFLAHLFYFLVTNFNSDSVNSFKH